MANESEELNIPKDSKGYLRRPYSFFKPIGGRKLSRSQLAMLGTVYTYATNHSGTRCNMPYSRFEEKLHISHSTVWRGVKFLQDAKFIEQDKSRRVGATYDCLIPEDQTSSGYIDTELFLYTTKFSLTESKKKTKRTKNGSVYLTKAQIDVLSLIYTHCKNPEGKKSFNGSTRSIAKILGIQPSVVEEAIEILMRADLIHRPTRGVNTCVRSIFTVNAKLLRKREKQYRKNTAPKARQSASERPEDAKAERERYYSILRQKAEERIEYFRSRLLRDEAYEQYHRELKQTEIDVAKAEVYRLPELGTLEKRHKELTALCRLRMKALKIAPEDLEPRYACKRCSDTGFTADGRMCDCYPRRRRS